jgi:hypothetical protein
MDDQGKGIIEHPFKISGVLPQDITAASRKVKHCKSLYVTFCNLLGLFKVHIGFSMLL